MQQQENKPESLHFQKQKEEQQSSNLSLGLETDQRMKGSKPERLKLLEQGPTAASKEAWRLLSKRVLSACLQRETTCDLRDKEKSRKRQ